MIASILTLIVIHYWWKNAIKKGVVSAGTMSKRKHLRNIQILSIILFVSILLYVWEFITGEEIGNFQSMILIGILFGMSRTLFEPFYTITTISKLDDFSLYLRPFDVDTQSILKNRRGFTKSMFFLPENLEKVICKNIGIEVAPVYAIGNPGAVLPTTLNSSCIYASDEDWKNAVTTLAHKSKMILLRVGDTDGCKWELLHCFNQNYLVKTIFIADDIDDLNLIQGHISIRIPDEIWNLNFHQYSIGLWLNRMNMWEHTELRTDRDCANMIKSFIAIHPSIKKGKVALKTILHTKSKSSWADTISLLLNPIAYVLYNRWRIKMIVTILSYLIISIIGVAILSYSISSDEEELYGVIILLGLPILLVSFIPWIFFAPKYSTAINSWGGVSIKARANKLLALWLLILFVFTCIIGVMIY